MATKFKQITNALVSHQENLERLPSGAPEEDKTSLDLIADDLNAAIRGQVDRYVERANETDEEQRLYGPKMIAKVRVVLTRKLDCDHAKCCRCRFASLKRSSMLWMTC